MKTFFSVLRTLLLVACLGLMGYSGWNLWQIYQSYQEGIELYDQLASLAVVETKEPDEEPVVQENGFPRSPAETSESSQEAQKGVGPDITVDFEALEEINPDVVGWIYCPDTAINYPVVQGQDNSYYLSHLLDGTSNKNGTIFMDAGNTAGFSDANTLIYGHHMKNGSMFAALEQYRKQDYYDEHPVLYLLTPEETYELAVFSTCVVTASDEVYQMGFSDQEEYSQWLARQVARSDVSTQVSPQATDRVVTLSTCVYDFENARYVVLAQLIPLGLGG